MLLSVRKDANILLCPSPCSALTFLFVFIFFKTAPRKAAVKTEKPEKNEGEKKTSGERKTSTEESKDTKG